MASFGCWWTKEVTELREEKCKECLTRPHTYMYIHNLSLQKGSNLTCGVRVEIVMWSVIVAIDMKSVASVPVNFNSYPHILTKTCEMSIGNLSLLDENHFYSLLANIVWIFMCPTKGKKINDFDILRLAIQLLCHEAIKLQFILAHNYCYLLSSNIMQMLTM